MNVFCRLSPNTPGVTGGSSSSGAEKGKQKRAERLRAARLAGISVCDNDKLENDMKKTFFLGLLATLMLCAPAAAVETMSIPTGVLLWDKSAAYKGYTLVSPNMGAIVYLVDMEGDVVHTWKTAGRPGMYAELLPNGNLLRAYRLENVIPFGGGSGVVQELDWSGKVVWEKKIHSPSAVAHHAYDRMPNGNTLILCWGYKSYEEAVAKGRAKGTIPKKGEAREPGYDGLWEDYIVEVDPQGNEVWSWHSWDHVGKGKDQLDIDYKLPVDNYFGDSDWLHFDSVRYIPETEQLLVVSHNLGEFYLIDKASGKIAYRWGNPAAYGKGRAAGFMRDGDQKLFGPHDATWLGDGKVMVFDNGWLRPEINRSRVLIVDVRTDEIVWEYGAGNLNSFFSAIQGSAQKLPNGNVFIASSQTGHLFEVTGGKDPRLVWEYVSPWTHKGPMALLTDDLSLGLDDINLMGNFVFRAYRYGKDYPGLKGRDLSKKQVLFPDAPNWRDLFEKAAKLKPAF